MYYGIFGKADGKWVSGTQVAALAVCNPTTEIIIESATPFDPVLDRWDGNLTTPGVRLPTKAELRNDPILRLIAGVAVAMGARLPIPLTENQSLAASLTAAKAL